jgi:DNA polymerase III epsilon subunit-like protein
MLYQTALGNYLIIFSFNSITANKNIDFKFLQLSGMQFLEAEIEQPNQEITQPNTEIDDPEPAMVLQEPKRKRFNRPKARIHVEEVAADEAGDFIFVDTETTGFSAKHHELIQLAALSEIDAFNVYVNPTLATLPKKISELTGKVL